MEIEKVRKQWPYFQKSYLFLDKNKTWNVKKVLRVSDLMKQINKTSKKMSKDNYQVKSRLDFSLKP